MLQDPKYQM